jgi:hypothetical protein
MDSNIIVFIIKTKRSFSSTCEHTINSVCNACHFSSRVDTLTKRPFPSTDDMTINGVLTKRPFPSTDDMTINDV